jgi:hypothetical protein
MKGLYFLRAQNVVPGEDAGARRYCQARVARAPDIIQSINKLGKHFRYTAKNPASKLSFS